MRAISLFSGVGGFDLGLGRAGIETVLQVEIDPQCRAVLERHWPGVERVSDVRDVGRRDSIDLIHGGFPCQDLSVAGQRRGLSGDRSGLFFEFIRVIREVRPDFALVENVPGLLSASAGRDFAVVLRELADAGAVDIAWRILDARWFGVAQRRRRLFVVADFGGERAAQILFEPEGCDWDPAAGRAAGEELAFSLAASVRGTGDGHGNAWNTTYVSETVRSHPRPGSNSLGNLVDVASAVRASDGHHGHSSPRGDGADNLIAAVADPITAHEGKTYTHEEKNNFRTHNVVGNALGVRRLTPLECERLQGFPDGWTEGLSDSHRYRMMGNAVCVPVAEWLGHRLVAVEAL